jgi:hypothetical protein
VKKILYPFLFLIFGIGQSAWADNDAWRTSTFLTDKGRYEAFRDRVLQIDNESGDTFFDTILFYDVFVVHEPFKSLAAQSSKNIDACVRFLSEQHEYTGKQRRIALLSMHRLDIDDLVVYVRKLVDRYRLGQVTLSDIVLATFQHDPYQEASIAHFDDPRIRSLLFVISGLPDGRKFGASVLNGEDWISEREERAPTDQASSKFLPLITHDFARFTRLFPWEDFKAAPDRAAWVSAIVRSNTETQNFAVKAYLDKILAPPPDNLTDDDLEYVWKVYNPDYSVKTLGDIRAFLTQIRDAIQLQQVAPP